MSSNAAPAWGLHAGLGGWLGPRLAVTLRATIITIAPEQLTGGPVRAENFRRTFGFLGPSLQYWIEERFWLGGGIGVAGYFMDTDGSSGLGFDLRAGYSFAKRGTNTFNVSLELVPGFYRGGGGISLDGTAPPSSTVRAPSAPRSCSAINTSRLPTDPPGAILRRIDTLELRRAS